MYEAKGERASHIYLLRARVHDGELVDVTDNDPDEDGRRHAASPSEPDHRSSALFVLNSWVPTRWI